MKKYILIILAFLLSFNSYAQTTNGGVRFVGTTVVMQLDDDARNIIRTIENERVAGGGAVFTLAERTYVNYIVTNFKVIGVWSKITALYGFVGGTAASHKWNWKDMRNLDAAYRLVFVGGLTHNSNGIDPNGTTGYANTFINPAVTLSAQTTLHFSMYFNENSTIGTEYDMGSQNLQTNTGLNGLTVRRSANTGFFASTGFAGNSVNRTNISNSDSRGYYIGNFLTTNQVWKNGQNIGQTPVALGTNNKPNQNIYLFAMGSTNVAGVIEPVLFSNKRTTLVSIGSGLTDTEAIRMSNIVTFAQGILNRQ